MKSLLRHSVAQILKPSLVSFNILIDATGKAGRDEEAIQLYVDLMSCRYRPNVVTYTSLINAVVQAGRYEKAEELYQRMLNDRLEPTSHTYATMIHACAIRGWTKYGHEVPLFPPSFIHLLLSTKSQTSVLSQICLAASKGAVTNALYGSMLHLYARNRWYSHAAAVLGEMGRQGVEPDVAAYGTLISACGESDDGAFLPLANVMQSSQFELCQLAYKLVFSPPANDDVVTEASSFLRHYARSKDLGSNTSLYNALIDALWARDMRLRAKLVFMQARSLLDEYPRPEWNEEAWSLDLRSLSKGASQVALLHWLEEVAERAAECPVVAPRLVLVTGGKEDSSLRPYSGRGKGAGIVKQTVEEAVNALGLPFVQSRRDSGPAQWHAETDQVVRWVSMYTNRLQLSNLPLS